MLNNVRGMFSLRRQLDACDEDTPLRQSFEAYVDYLQHEHLLLEAVAREVTSLQTHLKELESFYVNRPTRPPVVFDESLFVGLINRVVFFTDSVEQLKETQATALAEHTRLLEDVRRVLKETPRGITIKDAATPEKLGDEQLTSSIFRVRVALRESPALGSAFFDSLDGFCSRSAAFFQSHATKQEKTTQNGIVLYRGRSLAAILADEGRPLNKVPKQVEAMLRRIETDGMVEGIFRKCGKHTVVEELLMRMSVTDFSTIEVIDVASLLKRWVRDLPGGLIDATIQQNVVALWDMVDLDVETRKKQVALQMNMLNEENHTLFKAIMRLLKKIHDHQDVTLMNAENLAVCWTPALFDLNDLISRIKDITASVTYTILHCEELL